MKTQIETSEQVRNAPQMQHTPTPGDEAYEIALNVDRGDGSKLAKLIAQRDELLVACKQALDDASHLGSLTGQFQITIDCHRNLKSAIANVERSA